MTDIDRKLRYNIVKNYHKAKGHGGQRCKGNHAQGEMHPSLVEKDLRNHFIVNVQKSHINRYVRDIESLYEEKQEVE